MDFHILGPLEVRGDGDRPLELGGRKQRALLAVLLLHANRVVSSDRLVEALWGDSPPGTAATALQGYVSQLRKALAPAQPVVTRTPGYLIEVEGDELDLNRFERLVEEGRRALSVHDPLIAATRLREALDLWRGPALGDLADEPFARSEAPRLEELHLVALEERIDADLELGRHATLVGELERYVAEEPLRERPRAQLMLALYRSGRQAEALAAYREARRALVDELGIEPGRELQELEQAILRQDPALDLPAAPPVEPRLDPERVAPVEPRPPAAIREERKLVSVLFVDLVDFTARAELADPEDVRAALRPFHTAAKHEIERFGGTVEKFIGDAVMAVFGAPAAHEDDAERAVRAALAIRRWVADEGGDLRVRMAVNTGVALVSLDSRPREGEPIAAGDVVNAAQRLQVAAPVNSILVGEQTYRATSDAIEYREADPVEAKGKSEPIRAWEALEARSRFGVDLLREPRTPLVGRQRELDLLVSTLARVREERSPQLVTLVGVPGIGKSRLVFELFKKVEKDRELITWRQGRCLPYGDGVSFWALGEIVKAQAGILESDSSEQAEKKLHRAVVEVAVEQHEAPWIEQQLRPLVGAAGEPGARSGESFAAWRRFLQGVADRKPLVLVLEDLHWADEGLLEFVEEVADRLRDAPLLLLCTTRPELLERQPGWGGGKANALTLSLPPLSDEETTRLVSAVLEQPLLRADVHEALVARAAGNPLYAEQFARVLAEIGSLEELPETVQGIIAARIDGLLPQEKALLHDAAVVGKVFWIGAVESIGGVSRGQAEELLVALERKEFVQQARRSSVAGEAEYAFRHVLLRDVAYAQIPRAARSVKHRRAAGWIESLGRLEDHAEMLAHHYSSALEYTRAAGQDDPALAERARLALRAAGDRALVVAAYVSAARFYSSALQLWPDKDPERVWLLIDAGRASHAADWTGIDLLERGFEELRSRGDTDGAAEVAVDLARRFWLGGDRDAAYGYIDRALELTEGRGQSRARAYALVERAAYHMNANENSDAIRLAREGLPLTEALEIKDLQVRALDVVGSSRALSGDVGGLDDQRRAIALARESNAFYRLIVAEYNLYFANSSLGRLTAASEALGAFRRDVETYGTAEQRKAARTAEAHQAVFYGRWEEAARILDEVIAEADAGAAPHYEDPLCRALRASIALARGDLQRASADSEKALERARMTKDPQILAPALTLRSIALLAQGQREEASRLAAEVLAGGSVLVTALLALHLTATPVQLAWLLRDLGREAELLSTLESAPSTPWLEATSAIASGDIARSVELLALIGAPSLEAYGRLRAAEEMARLGRQAEAIEQLTPAVEFFRKVGAARYIAQAEELLAGRPEDWPSADI